MTPKVVGDGMIGRACRMCFPDDPEVTFYAAGVSNSEATDFRDFEREVERFHASLNPERTLVYFSTCMTGNTPYAKHKAMMEDLVKRQPKWLILRLPIVAGRTSNPHTLLNYLYSRISRSERFVLHAKARRNVIDVGDVVQIAEWLLNDEVRNEVVNVASPTDYPITQIVSEFEHLTGKQAVIDMTLQGSGSDIDIERLAGSPVDFGRNYLRRTLTRYYG